MQSFQRSLRLWLAMAAGAIAWPTAAGGAPYTVYFSGETTSYTNGQNNASDPTKIGQAFNGWLTFDTDFVQDRTLGFTPVGSFSLGMSQGGCSQILFGICNEARPRSPIVTAYQLNSPFAPSFEAVPMDERYADSSARTNSRVIVSPMSPSGGDYFHATRGQSTSQTSGSGNVTTFFEAMRYVDLGISSTDNTLLTSVFDLDAPINLLAAGLLSELRFTNRSQEQFCYGTPFGPVCTPWAVSPLSFDFVGLLSEVRIAPGPAIVPEPSSIGLLMLSFALCGVATTFGKYRGNKSATVS